MLDLTPLTDHVGDAGAALIVGAVVGVLFGLMAQTSRFCLRAAVEETAGGASRGRLAVWLAALGAGLAATQILISLDLIDIFQVRAITEGPSLSAAVIGGLLFGAGMSLANGCASRHLVLAGTGNLRAVVVFALFALTASVTIAGPLAPIQQPIAGAWRLDAGAGYALAGLGLGAAAAASIGLAVFAVSLALAIRARQPMMRLAAGAGVGLAIALGWFLTTALSRHTFEPTPVESTAFTAPAAHAASLLMTPETVGLSFDTGFLPGVLFGAFLAAALGRQLRFEWFESAAMMFKYAAGAVLMGFGGVLAIGCSVGSLANATALATASVIALAAMWAGALVTGRLIRFDWAGLLARAGHRAHVSRMPASLVAHQVGE